MFTSLNYEWSFNSNTSSKRETKSKKTYIQNP